LPLQDFSLKAIKESNVYFNQEDYINSLGIFSGTELYDPTEMYFPSSFKFSNITTRISLTTVDNLKKDDADISICKHIVLFDNNTQISTATHKKYILNPKKTLEMLLYDEDLDVSAWAKLYKKELFEGIKYPKGQLFEDAATTYKLIDKANKITFESEGKYFYIIRQDSITNRRFDERKAELIKSTKQMTEYIRNKYPELKQGCDRRDMYAYLSTLMQMTKEKDIKKYSKLQNEIMTYIKSNRSKILKDKRIPKRDRMALVSTFLGYRGFKISWNLYQNILRKKEKKGENNG